MQVHSENHQIPSKVSDQMEIWKEGAKKNHQHSRGTLNLNKKEKTASLFCNAEYRQENWKKLAEKKKYIYHTELAALLH